MSNLPWMKLHPTDWAAADDLQACSLPARGLWIEMLLLMWSSPVRGELRTKDGRPYDAARLARWVRADLATVEGLLAELEREQVFSRTADGCIFQRRMVREEQVRETEANKKATQRGRGKDADEDVPGVSRQCPGACPGSVPGEISEVRSQTSDTTTKPPPPEPSDDPPAAGGGGGDAGAGRADPESVRLLRDVRGPASQRLARKVVASLAHLPPGLIRANVAQWTARRSQAKNPMGLLVSMIRGNDADWSPQQATAVGSGSRLTRGGAGAPATEASKRLPEASTPKTPPEVQAAPPEVVQAAAEAVLPDLPPTAGFELNARVRAAGGNWHEAVTGWRHVDRVVAHLARSPGPAP